MAPDPRTERRLPLLVAALALVELALWYLAVPLVPRWRDELGLTTAEEGLALAAYAAAIVLLSLPCGALADRVGPRRVTLVSVLLAIAAAPALALVDSVEALVVVRFAQGAFAAATWTAGLAWVAAGVRPERRGRAIGLVESAAVAGSVLGPALGGPGVDAIGLGPLTLALSAVATLALLGLRSVPDTRAPTNGAPAGVLRVRVDRGSARGSPA